MQTDCRRNDLVVAAIPLARVIVKSYCKDHRVFSQIDEIEADAFAALVDLATSYNGASSWLAYVNYNLKFRLIDALRKQRGGRATNKHHDRQAAIATPEALEARAAALDDRDPALAEVDLRFAEVEAADALAYATRDLSDRTRWMIARRLEGESMSAIGEQLGITESRVCQIFATIRPRLVRALAE